MHVLYVFCVVLILVCGFWFSENGNFLVENGNVLGENRVSNRGGL